KQDVVSTEKMCFSCHDGFVLDSRTQWKKGKHGHPVGVKPTSKVKIPTSDNKTVFPLNDEGKVYCGTCHTAHGVSWNESESPVFMRVRNADSGLCLACHLEKGTGPEEGNHPVFEKLTGALPDKLMLKGAQVGTDNTVICQTCHVAHGAETYNSHLVMKPGRDSLCESCHQDKQSVVDSKHDLRKSNPEVKNSKGNTVKESGLCSACHVPHGGNGPALWAGIRKTGVDASAAACLVCHSKDGAANKQVLTKHNHPVGVPITRTGIRVEKGQWSSQSLLYNPESIFEALPLYGSNGERVDHDGDVGCGSCHDPHKRSDGYSNKDSKADKENTGEKDFIRMDRGETSILCLNCHIEKKSVLKSKHNPAVFQSEEISDSNQSKSDYDVCAACHQVHHAETSPLWTRKLGPGKAAVESLCNDCHRKEGLAEKKLTGDHSHPVGVSAKSMSDSGLPLYDKFEAIKGDNIDCATCHNLHQWDPVNALSEEGSQLDVEGDATNSFLRMTAVTGNLCGDCHHGKDRVLGTEHDLNITDPDAVNLAGEKIEESGVCGQCHMIHNAPEGLYLWARDKGNNEIAINSLCESCHAEGKSGEHKRPHNSKHPNNIKVWSQKLRARYGRMAEEALPVYNENNEISHMGKVACPTCHDVHKWWAGKDEKGPGKNTEGDVTNSFLRSKHTSNMVCADCHGKEALFRYKYFHSLTTHKKYWFSR
ncbi:MAG: hypothetical protein OEZ15_09035, partial [Gammaproteobacteria bacterium]|nr:hypothetical protein [Gammaproteobacteria bacterium]